MTISGNGFLPGATVSFSGGGITAIVTAVTNTEITAVINISISATPATTFLNRRSVTVVNPGGLGATLERIFTINKKF
jgi:hypothetical protein